MNELDEYQMFTRTTAIYPKSVAELAGIPIGLMYCGLKLAGEAGEVAEKIGKALRDSSGLIDEARNDDLVLELGDVMWYVARIADELGVTLSQVTEANTKKLRERKRAGKLGGSGDYR